MGPMPRRFPVCGAVTAAMLLGFPGCSDGPAAGPGPEAEGAAVVAPQLTGTEWVLPEGEKVPDLAAAKWRLVAFFSPT